MIDYSLTKRKPSALAQEQSEKYYAKAQVSEVLNINDFAAHIASHGSVYGRGDIYAILVKTVDCLKEMLLEGKKIVLGDLGAFSISLSSKGEENAENFTAQNIKKAYAIWSKGEMFKNLCNEASFNYTATRKAQAAIKKAQRQGITTVNIDPNWENGNDKESETTNKDDGNTTEEENN